MLEVAPANKTCYQTSASTLSDIMKNGRETKF